MDEMRYLCWVIKYLKKDQKSGRTALDIAFWMLKLYFSSSTIFIYYIYIHNWAREQTDTETFDVNLWMQIVLLLHFLGFLLVCCEQDNNMQTCSKPQFA